MINVPKTVYALIFISLAFNSTIFGTEIYLSNFLAFIIFFVSVLSLTPRQIYREQKYLYWLLTLILIILLNIDSLIGIKWIYIFLMYYGFQLFFTFNNFKIENVLITFSMGMLFGTIFSFQFVDLSYFSGVLSSDSRGSINALGSTNSYAVLSAYATLIFFHYQSLSQNKYFQLFSLISLLILITAQISTLSRGGFLTLIFGLAIYSYFKGTLVRNIIFFATLSFIFLLTFSGYFDLDLISIYNRYTFYEDATGTGRTVLWAEILSQMNSPLPFIFGNGAGSLDIYTSISDGLYYHSYESAHNTYLDIFYQFGIIGLFLFITFLCYTIININKVSNQNDRIILLSLFLPTVLNMFFDSYYGALQISAIYSLFFALYNRGYNAS